MRSLRSNKERRRWTQCQSVHHPVAQYQWPNRFSDLRTKRCTDSFSFVGIGAATTVLQLLSCRRRSDKHSVQGTSGWVEVTLLRLGTAQDVLWFTFCTILATNEHRGLCTHNYLCNDCQTCINRRTDVHVPTYRQRNQLLLSANPTLNPLAPELLFF